MTDIDPGMLDKLFNAHAAMRRKRDDFNVVKGNAAPGDRRQLEYYPPWESHNPTPGKATVEVYNTGETPEVTQNLLLGDMMHYIGSVDPRNNQAIDPTFRALKEQFLTTLTPEQVAVDRRAYDHQAPMYQNPPAFDDWMDFNRGDAYLRGYITPDARDEWRKQGVYTEDQKKLLDQMRQYIIRGSLAPGMMR